MRRFSKAAAAAILLFTANGFAGYDNCTTTEQSSMLSLMSLTCVSCGVQMYYNSQGKGDSVNPSERWLATLAVGARNIRTLNPGEKGWDAESIVKKDTAEMSLQKVVISQIQAYGFCKQKIGEKFRWTGISRAISTNSELSSKDLTGVVKQLGFEDNTLNNFKMLLGSEKANERGVVQRDSLENLRRAFRENASTLIAKKDVDDELKSCLLEMRAQRVEQMSDAQSYQLCATMASSCDIEPDFCKTQGMVLTASPGSSSGSTQQGGTQKPPRPPAPQPLRRQLPPPPPASVQ